MPVTSGTLRVDGLRELQGAFALADKRMAPDLRETLRGAADPVRADAEALARVRIRRIGFQWSAMRVGVTRTFVYVAPKKRGSRDPSRKRRNLAGLLMDRAMIPALDHNVSQVEQRVEKMLGEAAQRWGRF